MFVEISITAAALMICLFLVVTIIRKKPLFQKVNNIIMEGNVDHTEKNTLSTTALFLLIILCCLLIALLLIQGSKVEVSQNQTVNINTEQPKQNLIDINTASVNELILLDGVGDVKANEIIEYREKKKFERISELMNIVGDTTYNNIKDYVKIGGD